MERYAYIYLNSSEGKEIILSSFENATLENENNIYKLTCYECDCFELLLNNIISSINTNLDEASKVLIVPYFDDRFVKYLNYVNGEVKTVTDVMMRHINEPEVLTDIKTISNFLDQNDYDTIKAYIQCNMNILKAAEALYMHRNSINYRLNQFYLKTKMNYKDVNTMLFIKFIKKSI